MLAQLFFKASNTVRTIILINYQIKIFFHEIKIFLATTYYIITSTESRLNSKHVIKLAQNIIEVLKGDVTTRLYLSTIALCKNLLSS